MVRFSDKKMPQKNHHNHHRHHIHHNYNRNLNLVCRVEARQTQTLVVSLSIEWHNSQSIFLKVVLKVSQLLIIFFMAIITYNF